MANELRILPYCYIYCYKQKIWRRREAKLKLNIRLRYQNQFTFAIDTMRKYRYMKSKLTIYINNLAFQFHFIYGV